MPNLGALQILHSFLRAQFTLPHLKRGRRKGGGRGKKEKEREREREREGGGGGEALLQSPSNHPSHMEHCQSSALKSPPLLVAALFPISDPVFLNTSTLPLSVTQSTFLCDGVRSNRERERERGLTFATLVAVATPSKVDVCTTKHIQAMYMY